MTVRRGRVVGGRGRPRETERQRDRETETDRDRQRDRDRQTDRQTDRQRQRQTEKETNTETERYYTSFCMMRVRVCSYVLLHSSLWAQVPVGVGVRSPVQVKPSLSRE